MVDLYAAKSAETILTRRKELSPVIQPNEVPHFFIPALSPDAYRAAQQLLAPRLVSFTGEDILKGAGNLSGQGEQMDMLNYMLELTVGEKVKVAGYKSPGDDRSQSSWREKSMIQSAVISYINDQGHCKRILFSDKENTSSVHAAVESENIGFYELRVKRLGLLQDRSYEFYTSENEDPKLEYLRLKRIYKMRSLYYSIINEQSNIYCPAFYQFRMSPRMQASNLREKSFDAKLDFAFECEEYMGRLFIQDIATAMKKYREAEKGADFRDQTPEERQGSLVAHLWGQKLAKMCRQLNAVRHENVRGYGRITEIHGGAKSSKRYICEMKDEGEQLWKVKAQNVLDMLRRIEGYFKENDPKYKEKEEDFAAIRKFLKNVWETDDYVSMWRDKELFLVPERLTEYNIRVYAKVTRLSNVISDEEGRNKDAVEIRRFNPQFERVVASLPSDPAAVSLKTQVSMAKSLLLMRMANAKNAVDRTKTNTKATARGSAAPNEAAGGFSDKDFEYEFKKKLEFEDRRSATPPHFGETSSVYGSFIAGKSERQLKAVYALVQKKNPALVSVGVLGKRTRYHMAATLLWMINVRLRKLKLYDTEFEDKKDYFVCLNSLVQGFSCYFERTQTLSNERCVVQAEYLFQGMREAVAVVEEIEAIKAKEAALARDPQFSRTVSFQDEKTFSLQPSQTVTEESKRVLERAYTKRQDMQRYVKAKEEELGVMLEELAYPTLDKFLLFKENLIHIKRDRYYQPALREHWEPDMEKPRYMKQVNAMTKSKANFMPERLTKPENVSDVQRQWIDPKPIFKTMLHPCPANVLEDEVTIEKHASQADTKMKSAIDKIISRIKKM